MISGVNKPDFSLFTKMPGSYKNKFMVRVFKHILAWMKKKKLPTSKIAVQKIIFYLQEKGGGSGYEFQPTRHPMNRA